MNLLFHHTNGQPRTERSYYAPGKSILVEASQHVHTWPHTEGDTVTFHVGHGVYHDYIVAAQDASTALLVRQ